MSEAKEELPPPTLAGTMIRLLPLIFLTWYLCQNQPGKDPNYRLKECGKNLHAMGVAIEKDRLLSDEKLYNSDLTKIFGDKPLPECPVGGSEAYTEGYKVAADNRSYVLTCKGEHHTDASVPSDYPRIAFSVDESGIKAGDDTAEDVAPEASETPATTETPSAVAETPSPEAAETPEAEATPEPEAESSTEAPATEEASDELAEESSEKEDKPQEEGVQ